MNTITYNTFTKMVDLFVQLGINEGVFSKEIETSNHYNSISEVTIYHRKKALIAELILVSLYDAGGQITEDEQTGEDRAATGYQMGYNKGCEETKQVFLDGLRQYASDFARREKVRR